MYKFRRDVDHKLRVLQHADKIGDVGKHVGILASVEPASIAGGRRIGSRAWQASKIARQLRKIPLIARLQRSSRKCCTCARPTA